MVVEKKHFYEIAVFNLELEEQLFSKVELQAIDQQQHVFLTATAIKNLFVNNIVIKCSMHYIYMSCFFWNNYTSAIIMIGNKKWFAENFAANPICLVQK